MVKQVLLLSSRASGLGKLTKAGCVNDGDQCDEENYKGDGVGDIGGDGRSSRVC